LLTLVFPFVFIKFRFLENEKLVSDYITRVPGEISDIKDWQKETTSTRPQWFLQITYTEAFLIGSKMPGRRFPLHMFNATFGKIKYFDETWQCTELHIHGMYSSSDSGNKYANWIKTLKLLQATSRTR